MTPARRFGLPFIGMMALAVAGCGGNPQPSASEEPGGGGVQTSAPPGPMADATSATPAMAERAPTRPVSCSAEIGETAARKLVQQCIAVSPATRPPCNVANSCAMIGNEVARGCAIIGADAVKTPECGGIDPVSREAAAAMVRRYYAAINARDFASAWTLWGDDGGTSGKTLQTFEEGFARTVRTHVEIGTVSDVEGGAGSLYVTVPVTVDAELANGQRQRFTGSYALRQLNRGMGISQGWHIETARLRPA